MKLLNSALNLAASGFHVFPVVPNGKTPLIEDFPEQATMDPNQIRKWWQEHPTANTGISTSKFGTEGEALAGVDIDNKGQKRGTDEVKRLRSEGKAFPRTYTQVTPTGGYHLVYRCKEPVKQGVSVLGEGLDIRGRGGYLVGAGSIIGGRSYTADRSPIAEAPDWLLHACGRAREKVKADPVVREDIDDARALDRAIFYLEHQAPLAVQGHHGDQTTFRVAAQLKDFGLDEFSTLSVLSDAWNERCQPPWTHDELKQKVKNAYQYGQEPIGVSAPELEFKSLVDANSGGPSHPFTELNKEYAFVMSGGGSHILAEKTDPDGNFLLKHWSEEAFHKWNSAKKMTTADGKVHRVTRLWMDSPERRSYLGLVFRPGKKLPPDWYNLWRGFSVKPLEKGEKSTPQMQDALDRFLMHAEQNVCRGEERLFKWLMAYFAHIIQKPWENPGVALVFRGEKGVGKNTIVECVGELFRENFMVAGQQRYLLSNFNSHLENKLFFVLDEAFWSGSKEAEGILKAIITGKQHNIERKGEESYQADNFTRVAILGNANWVVPASEDERRYAVFEVGEGLKQNREWFKALREGMANGGHRLLLRYLMDYDISGIDVGCAPRTEGLLDQKLSSLEPFTKFWFECLTEGRIVYSDFGEDWPETMEKSRFRSAFRRFADENNLKFRLPDDRSIGREFKKCAPSMEGNAKKRVGENTINCYKILHLEQARKEWESYIGHKVEWPK